MFGLAFGFVPLYRIFCDITGFGGATQTAIAAPSQIIDRKITVRFDSNTSPNLPWEFKPEQKDITLKVGEQALAFFYAKNISDHDIKGTSTFNVTPVKAAPYFNKVQCFCFEEQTIAPGEKKQFPVTFFVDPEIENDKNLDEIKTITLSYTFFKMKEQK